MAEDKKEETIVDVGGAYNRFEQFLEDNKKSLSIVFIAIIVVVGGWFGYKKFYLADLEASAQTALYKAEKYFLMDSLDLAINGQGEVLGLEQIVNDYGLAPSGNLAEYYLGMCYLKKGEFEKAIEHLSEFDCTDQIIGPVATGAIGDAHLELGRTDEAITFYMKAAGMNNNKFTSPVFLKKAGHAYESKGSYKDAIGIYEKIQSEYSESQEGRDMDKYIARAKAMAGI